ncbi:MAG TPA: pyridoxal phosphate-dependent aminotransferase [Bacteroidales bacterium]|nr:pyridoxal phosphate-dependent aminotransferase [Bacteroidales bacterium]
MPQISEKGSQMPASPIRKLVPYAEEAKRKGIKVYHLNIGNPDLPTPAVAIDAVKKLSLTTISYGHSAGDESFRKKMAAYYKHIGIEVHYDEILVTSGGSEALLFGMMSCVNTDEEIIVPEPFYANYYGFSLTAGLKIVPVCSSIETGFALPPITEFEKLITPKTKAIIICNPNNPTGYLYSEEELKILRDMVKKHDLFLFSDEVYREFCYDGRKHISAMNLKGIEEHVVMVDSLSKRYSACGIRVGAMVSHNKEVIATALKFGQQRLCPPVLGQMAGEAALDLDDDYYKSIQQEYSRRRDFLVDALNKIPGVVCPKPSGAFYVIAKLPVDDSEKFAKWLLSDFVYQGQTLMVAPANGFYSSANLGTDEVRLAYVLNVDDLKNAIQCLSEALKVYPGKK